MKATGILLPGLLAGSFAQAAPVTIVRQHTTYEVAADGTWTTEVDTLRRVDEQQAVGGLGQAPVQYSDSLQTLEILEAYTITRDGTRIDVPADKIITQQLPVSAGAPTFSDNKVKNVVFPQVEVGATLGLRYRVKQLKPFLPGMFSVVSVFNVFFDTQQGAVTLRAPEKMQLHFSTRAVKGGEVKSKVAGQREWHWTYTDAKAILPEPGSVIPESFSPYVAASTLETWPQLADTYMVGSKPAAKVTPAVQKLADEITSGMTDKRQQAEAIYRWVSTQIRYVAIAMGTGGYVPHQAEEIIAARYGDCKDKTTLLTALLNAKGIRAMPVLIHTAATFKLPDTVILGAFNHAITYLPDWDLFVDSTSGFAPFGVLPPGLNNKQVLLAGDEASKPVVRTIAAPNPARDRLVIRTVATLSADGSVAGTNTLQPLGTAEPMLRGSLGSVPEAMRPSLAKSMLSGQPGEASLKFGDARDLATPFSFVFEFNTPQRVNVPGPGALATAFGMPLPSGPGAFSAAILQRERTLDYPCPESTGAEDVLELTLPPEVKITTLPKAASVESPYGRFSATYEVKDGKLLVRRILEVIQPRAVCTTADSPELRKFATAISQQLRAQVLYQ
jgi:transglutaminase-like putative cysteine protease